MIRDGPMGADMWRDSVQRTAPGRVVRSLAGHWTYDPDPLPPALAFSPDLVHHLSEADRALGELAGLGRMIPNPHLLIRPFLRREAILSSRIEGTQTDLEQLLQYEERPEKDPPGSDAREVGNYVLALEHGLRRLPELPVSLRLIRELHDVLMTGVRGGDRRPGHFRTVQNYISDGGGGIESARFVPPGPMDLDRVLSEFERYVGKPHDLPLLVWLALVHYQFETIHPFEDGNGRVGRLLISLLLVERQALTQPLLYLSAFFERNRSTYYDLLLGVSRDGDWDAWITFFLRGVRQQAVDAVRRSALLIDLWTGYRATLQAAGGSGRLLSLLDSVFADPLVTARRVGERLDVTPRAARQNIDRLVDAGILTEITGRQRDRMYLARDVVAIINRDT